MTSMEFYEWVRWVFDRPVRDDLWYFERGQDLPWTHAPVVIRLFGRLCEECPAVLADYSDAQVAQGLAYLFLSVFRAAEAGADQVAAVVRGFRLLYENLFAVRCDEVKKQEANPLNDFVFMLWDSTPAGEHVERELVSMLAKVLFVRHAAVQESALHGLGHLQLDFPAEVATAVDRYLSSDSPVSGALRAYAARARGGEVM